MQSTVTLTVMRYRPEQEAEPAAQEYEVPYRKDWVVLDALNYIKDNLDGSLSYRWSCRMGVCSLPSVQGGCVPSIRMGASLHRSLACRRS